MTLLEKLQHKEKQKKSTHPLLSENFEVRVNYLMAVAYFLSIDEKRRLGGKEEYVALIKTLECEDTQNDLLKHLKEPYIEEFDEIFNYIGEKIFRYYFIIEILHLQNDLEFNEIEYEFIDIVLPKLQIKREELELIGTFYKEDKEKIYYKIKKNEPLYDAIKKIAPYIATKYPIEERSADSLVQKMQKMQNFKEYLPDKLTKELIDNTYRKLAYRGGAFDELEILITMLIDDLNLNDYNSLEEFIESNSDDELEVSYESALSIIFKRNNYEIFELYRDIIIHGIRSCVSSSKSYVKGLRHYKMILNGESTFDDEEEL